MHLASRIVELPKPSVGGILEQRLPAGCIARETLQNTCRERLDALAGLICDDTVCTRNPFTFEQCLTRSECKVNVAHNVELTGGALAPSSDRRERG